MNCPKISSRSANFQEQPFPVARTHEKVRIFDSHGVACFDCADLVILVVRGWSILDHPCP